jgi:uncharacterized membrane protein (UPF0127 family)
MPRRGPLRLLHPRSGQVLAERLLVPRTFVGRGLGLMFKPAIDPGTGLWIVPCNGIHMFFMNFPIDAVFLDREQRVVRICPNLRPWRMVPIVYGAHSVLELPANTVGPLGLVRGEPLSIEPA